MSNVDNKLLKLGFVSVIDNNKCGSWVYENMGDDQHVDIDFDGENWFVHSSSISTQKDWYGNDYHEPVALSYEDMKAFMDKIEELKVSQNQNAI